MKRFLRLPLFFLLVLPSWLHAQNNFWSDADESAAHSRGLTRTIVPVKYRTLALDTISLKSALHAAPLEFSFASVFNPLVLALPMPDGSLAHFKVVEYSMMEPALQAKFPDIRTYSGQGIEDPTATLKLNWPSAFGLHAMILSPATDRFGSIHILAKNLIISHIVKQTCNQGVLPRSGCWVQRMPYPVNPGLPADPAWRVNCAVTGWQWPAPANMR
ncbi:MAG: hypothetical protein U0T56_12905 [Ferruginibacter sp.]